MTYLLIPIIIIFIIPSSYLLVLIISDYKPNNIEDAIMKNSNKELLPNEFSVTTLNLGYCSLDKESDFFFEGGKNTRGMSKEKVMKNLKGNSRIMMKQNSDFYLFQEIDESGSRSHNVNQLDFITSMFNKYNSTYAFNYKMMYLFYPFLKPMGSAYGGLLTLSKYRITDAKRYKLKGQESFPRKLIFLKRCMVVNTIKTIDNKHLYMINIHLSAYDKNGDIRAQQVKYIIDFLRELYDKNKNYIILGGDWNHLLPKDLYREDMPLWVNILPSEIYQSKFNLVYDTKVNTVRSLNAPYIKGENFETVIDGFLISPNIDTVDVKTLDFGFEFTDHNPVKATFRLK